MTERRATMKIKLTGDSPDGPVVVVDSIGEAEFSNGGNYVVEQAEALAIVEAWKSMPITDGDDTVREVHVSNYGDIITALYDAGELSVSEWSASEETTYETGVMPLDWQVEALPDMDEGLRATIKAALEGDSNDAEREALAQVAQEYGIEYNTEDD